MSSALPLKIEEFAKVVEQVPELRYAGDPVLRQAATKALVDEGVQIGRQLGTVLGKYREITGAGRGLAAPQIGIGKAVFVTFIDDACQIFINPVIREKSNSTCYYKELCLSSGIMSADVERPEWIVMVWQDESGDWQERKVEGFLARLYQHEEAHLRGVLNLDETIAGGIEMATFDPLNEKLRSAR